MLLDGRPARTTMKKPIALDNAVLATAIAAEWDMVEGDIITKHMPLVRRTSSMIACLRVCQRLRECEAESARDAERERL